MVNVDRDRFVLKFSDEFESDYYTVNFDVQKIDNYNFFDDEKNFVNTLAEKIKDSVNFDKFVGHTTNLKEMESLERLRKWCTQNNLNFKNNSNPKSAIDIFINDIPIQAKYTSQKESKHLFHVSAKSQNGIDEHGFRTLPYNVEEFEFIVIETSEFEGKFLFIHQYDLYKMGILRSENFNGKRSFGVCSFSSSKETWDKKFWDCNIFLEAIKDIQTYKNIKLSEIKELNFPEPKRVELGEVKNVDVIRNKNSYFENFEIFEEGIEDYDTLVQKLSMRQRRFIKNELPIFTKDKFVSTGSDSDKLNNANVLNKIKLKMKLKPKSTDTNIKEISSSLENLCIDSKQNINIIQSQPIHFPSNSSISDPLNSQISSNSSISQVPSNPTICQAPSPPKIKLILKLKT